MSRDSAWPLPLIGDPSLSFNAGKRSCPELQRVILLTCGESIFKSVCSRTSGEKEGRNGPSDRERPDASDFGRKTTRNYVSRERSADSKATTPFDRDAYLSFPRSYPSSYTGSLSTTQLRATLIARCSISVCLRYSVYKEFSENAKQKNSWKFTTSSAPNVRAAKCESKEIAFSKTSRYRGTKKRVTIYLSTMEHVLEQIFSHHRKLVRYSIVWYNILRSKEKYDVVMESSSKQGSVWTRAWPPLYSYKSSLLRESEILPRIHF